MKVILLENLRRIGSIGEIIEVKRGFARNYLIANRANKRLIKANVIKLIKDTKIVIDKINNIINNI